MMTKRVNISGPISGRNYEECVQAFKKVQLMFEEAEAIAKFE